MFVATFEKYVMLTYCHIVMSLVINVHISVLLYIYSGDWVRDYKHLGVTYSKICIEYVI